jgi:hypothetical protein
MHTRLRVALDITSGPEKLAPATDLWLPVSQEAPVHAPKVNISYDIVHKLSDGWHSQCAGRHWYFFGIWKLLKSRDEIPAASEQAFELGKKLWEVVVPKEKWRAGS